MPASLFAEMERTGGSANNGRPGSLQDQRAYELALELSMFGLSNENESVSLNGGNFIENGAEPRGGVGKKSQNTTECVPVPSSEHVAEIVGRQGCKIKALRAKTNTYIKTPVRGEEPVFVVTGRKEDVSAAKREILSAADHFSQIRAQRKNNLNGSLMPGPNSNIPGQTTIQVRVPYRVVGLVVGPKGATIKRIQQQTNTYIVTPSRDKEPIFEVTGLPDSVESARKEIEAHIAMRTGSLIDSCDDNEFGPGILDSAFANNLNAVNSALFKTDLNNDFMTPFSRESNNILDLATDDIFSFSTSGINGSTKHNDPFSSVFGGSFSNGFNIYEVDEGLGDSPTFDVPAPSLTTSWPDFNSASLTESLFGSTSVGSSSSSSRSGLADLNQRSNSISGALADFVLREHPPARRIQSDPEVSVVDVDGVASCVATLPSFSPLINTAPGGLINFPVTSSSAISCGSDSSSPIESLAPGNKIKRDCIVCLNGQVVAALVPCGHNCFCYDCARTICEKQEPECPICREPASQAIRIFS